MKLITKTGEKLKILKIQVETDNGKTKYINPKQINNFIFEPIDETMDDLHSYEIKRLGNLSLCFKTFIGKTPQEDDIEISMWDKSFLHRWTIASFEPHYDDEDIDSYELVSCGSRLNDKDINWKDFGKLVKLGYEWLDEYLNKKENNEEEDE